MLYTLNPEPWTLNPMLPRLSRRSLLKRTALAGAAVGFPTILPSTVFGANAPSKRISLGHIGVGGQGNGLLSCFLALEDSQCVATCDPLKDRREAAAQTIDAHYAGRYAKDSYAAARAYTDFRELIARDDIDAVVIATPDHWHVSIGIAAVKAGKDVYVEKPLGISIEQNKALREAVRRYNAVFQYGTQQRSFCGHCATACELVRNGYIGTLKAVNVIAPNGESGGNPAPQPVPAGLDYDLWLGPAPVTPYTHDRVLSTGRWHIYDYALGFIAGWGAHPLDIAHWGYPHVPVEYQGTGRIPTTGLFDTVLDWNVRGRYASGVEFTFTAGPDKTTFVGTDGWVAASRGGIDAEPKSLLSLVLKPTDQRLFHEANHYQHFIACCKSRKTPVSTIASAVQSDFISHLSDIAIRTGRKITWDEQRECIVGDETAQRMQTRAMRAPWHV